jgi:hypothetical protein
MAAQRNIVANFIGVMEREPERSVNATSENEGRRISVSPAQFRA